jgi:hypothetical protein
MPINSPNIQWPWTADALEGDRGTMALGILDGVPAVPEEIVATEDFEGGVAGTGTWTITTSSPHTGTNCLRSAVIGSNASTDQVFNIPATATALRFWYRVSSEPNFDFFRVYKDAIIPGNLLLQVSGTANTWTQVTLNVAGATTVTMRYIKDGSGTAGLDASFIDDFEWIIPGVPAEQNYEPFHLNADREVKVTTSDLSVIEAELAAITAELVDVNIELDTQTGLLTTIETDLDQVNAELDTQTVLLTHMDGDLHDINTELDTQTAVLVNIETDLDAVNAELDAQTTLLTHIDGDLHAANTSLDNIESDIDNMNINLFTMTILLAAGVAGTATNGAQVTTAGAGQIAILAANANRKSCIIKNIGAAGTCRIGVTGVTATTGIAQLAPGDTLILQMPFCPDEQLFMIREAAVNTTVLVSEQV